MNYEARIMNEERLEPAKGFEPPTSGLLSLVVILSVSATNQLHGFAPNLPDNGVNVEYPRLYMFLELVYAARLVA